MTVDSVSELLSWEPPSHKNIIADGILPAETGMLVFGSPKSWKSIFALHTAYCIASGESWFGFNTTQSVAFKYQVELPKRVDQERTAKYLNSHRPSHMFFKTSPYFKIDTGYGKQSLEKDIQLVSSRSPNSHIVLILDPVYLLISGHISDDYDIKKLLDNLNDLKYKLHISIILIHHTHKTRVDSGGNIIDLGSEEAMGSSYLQNWADTVVRLKLLNPFGAKNKVEMSFELSRHAQSLLPNVTMEWNRSNLHPTILERKYIEEDELSVRGLKK